MSDKTKLIIRAILLPLSDYSFIQNDTFDEINKIISTGISKQSKFDKFNETNIKKLMQVTELKNIDEAKLLLQKFHYKKFTTNKYTNIYQYYFELINDITKMFITHRDGEICLKYWTSEIEKEYFDNCTNLYKLTLWSELTRFIAPDILYVNFLVQNNYKIFSLHGLNNVINLADDQLDKVLSKGVSETHVHINATNSFDQTWEILMDMTNEKKYNDKLNAFNFDLFELNTSPSLNKKHEIVANIKYSAVLRIVIMNYCNGMRLEKKSEPRKSLDKIKKYLDKRNFEDTKKACDEFYQNRPFLGLNDDILPSDIFKCEIDTIEENIFLYYVLENYKENKLEENVVAYFFDYLRIKNDLVKIFIQTNSIKGLDYFQKHYTTATKIKSFNKENNNGKDYVLQYILNNKKIKKIELRPGIGYKQDYVKDIKEELYNIFYMINNSYNNNQLDDDRHIGIIYSFLKKEDHKSKCLLNALDNENYNDYLYFQVHRYEYFKQLDAFNEIRKFCPTLSKYFVGIDAASIENNTEPWVFAPIYKKARNFNFTDNSINISNQSLRFTFHVGEDFRDIISGLRHIDEVIDKFGFKAGDRIGHGIALGIDIDYWFDNNETIIIPAIEYLDNLLWLWGIESNNNFSMLKDGYLERKILELADRIFGNNKLGCYDLWKAYQQKFEIYELNDCKSFLKDNKCEFQKENFKVESVSELVHLMHCSVYLEKMSEPIIMTINKKDVELYKSVQKFVLEKVAKTGIVVETNPSSNVTIGEIKDMINHYIFNLVPIENPSEGVIATISSDDPSVFNTNICNEIAYIYHALIDKGYNRTLVLEWIKKVVEYGMDYSFVKNKLTKGDVDKILEELRPM